MEDNKKEIDGINPLTSAADPSEANRQERKKTKREWPKLYIEEYISGAIMIYMIGQAFANVMSRYILHITLNATEEIVTYALLWAIFLGAPIACIRGMNMGFSLFMDLCPKKTHKYFELATTFFSLIVWAIMFYGGSLRTWQHFNHNVLSNATKVPMWLFSISIPIGSICYIIRTIQVSVKAFKCPAPTVSQDLLEGGEYHES